MPVSRFAPYRCHPHEKRRGPEKQGPSRPSADIGMPTGISKKLLPVSRAPIPSAGLVGIIGTWSQLALRSIVTD